MWSIPLGALSAIFSLMAGGFWMAAAYGRSVFPLMGPSQPISESDLPQHQAKWNARAALCASIAAIGQAMVFFVEKWAVLIP
jgi:hypothetical protein